MKQQTDPVSYLNARFSLSVNGKFRGAGALSSHEAALLLHKLQRTEKHRLGGYLHNQQQPTFRVGGKTIKLYDK